MPENLVRSPQKTYAESLLKNAQWPMEKEWRRQPANPGLPATWPLKHCVYFSSLHSQAIYLSSNSKVCINNKMLTR